MVARAPSARRRIPERFKAMAWLERAHVARDPFLALVKSDLLLRNLHADPRFKAFLRKMKLPD